MSKSTEILARFKANSVVLGASAQKPDKICMFARESPGVLVPALGPPSGDAGGSRAGRCSNATHRGRQLFLIQKPRSRGHPGRGAWPLAARATGE
jgi:hypothetical protein